MISSVLLLSGFCFACMITNTQMCTVDSLLSRIQNGFYAKSRTPAKLKAMYRYYFQHFTLKRKLTLKLGLGDSWLDRRSQTVRTVRACRSSILFYLQAWDGTIASLEKSCSVLHRQNFGPYPFLFLAISLNFLESF